MGNQSGGAAHTAMQLRQIDEEGSTPAGDPATTVQPLPPGWEKKLDANTGKVFYVNHDLKVRSWVDPRTTPQEGWQVEVPLTMSSPAVAAHMPALAVVDRVPVHVGPSQMPRVLVPRDGPAPHAIDYPPDQLWSMQREANGRTSAAFYSAHDGAVPAPPIDFSVQRVPNCE